MWEPNPAIRIEGVYYTDQTLQGVQITYGKTDPTEAFRPAFATATLISDATGLDINILDDVVIFMDDTTGPQQVFHGKVSDVSVNLIAKDWAETSITIMSPLAKLAKRQVGASGYPQSFDGEMIQAILDDATDSIWTEMGGTWLTQQGTWQDIENLIDGIDTGDFELAAYSSGLANALQLITNCEISGMGHITENTDGQMGYQAAGARMIAAGLGFTELQANDVIIDGLQSQQTTGDLRNESIVATHNGTTQTAQDITSIQTYGRVTKKFDTYLKNTASALQFAERDVKLYAYPRSYISGFSTRLSAIDGTQVDDIIGITMGTPVRIYGLPSVIASDPYSGFVEGWSWVIDRKDAEIKFYVSDYALSVVSQEWKNVENTWLWNTISTIPTWKTLEVIY